MISKVRPGLALAALVCSAACGQNGTTLSATPASAVRPAAGHTTGSKISHVIVIIQENRSFESLFAGYPNANAPMTGCASPAPSGSLRPTTSSSPCPAGDTLEPLHKVTFQNNSDLKHNWKSSMIDWNNGQMDGFSQWGTVEGKYKAYAYVERRQTTPYWTMAKQYVLADEMFPTEFGGSFTAHLTLVAGTDDVKLPGRAEVDFPNAAPDDCDSPPGTKSSYVAAKPYRKLHHWEAGFPCFDQFNTMAQVLDNAGISWKFYATRLLDAGFWEPFEAIKYVRYGTDWKTNIITPQTKVLTDAKYGQLASVSWVTPTGPQSDHPSYHSDEGPSWVSSVVNAIGKSSYWSTSAIIVVWDDWGGFFDNAAPPQLDYRGLGIRVPCLIISPYAKRGYVSHVQYEFGSILRFVEEVNGLPAGSVGTTADGYTDGRATSLDDAFDFSQKPRKFSAIKSKYPLSRFLNEPPSNDPVDTE
ncbi:MAG: alkaline phosphatase family protein [Candidatus Cybelea sp.]